MSQIDKVSIGVDFGTTNTAIAIARPGEAVRMVPFQGGGELIEIYRSVLCFEKVFSGGRLDVSSYAGPNAISAYLTTTAENRFLQSFKSHVASRSFLETQVFTRRLKFEDLLSEFFGLLQADVDLGVDVASATVVAGRPVAFAGNAPDTELALERYDAGYRAAGFGSPYYVYEPLGAAFHYAQSLQSDALVLIGDFGGGTSDFSLIRFHRQGGSLRAEPIGNAGLDVAGDAFDYRIIDHIVSPELGKGSLYRQLDKTQAMPNHFYANFAKWHQLASLKSRESMAELNQLLRMSLEPDRISNFIDIIRNDRGFNVSRAVSDVKIALSSERAAMFDLRVGELALNVQITREEFQGWIEDDLARIEQTVEGLLQTSGVAPGDIDNVFLTGGSSFIPAVRQIFERRFGEGRLSEGDQFGSVAAGLALIGLEADVGSWTSKE